MDMMDLEESAVKPTRADTVKNTLMMKPAGLFWFQAMGEGRNLIPMMPWAGWIP